MLAYARLHTPVFPSVHIINVAFGQSPFSCENTSLKDAFLHQNRTWDSVTMVPKLVQYVIMAITLLVVAVPEGLPLAVSLTLAYSVRQRCVDLARLAVGDAAVRVQACACSRLI